jgi:signal transduction histidine kinase
LKTKDLLLSIIAEALGEFGAEMRAETDQKLNELRNQLDGQISDLRSMISDLQQQVSDLRQQDRGIVTLPRRA